MATLAAALATVIAVGCDGSNKDQLSSPAVQVDASAPPPTGSTRATGLLEGLRAAVPGVDLPPAMAEKVKAIDPSLTDTRGAAVGYDLATIALVATEAARSDAPGRIADVARSVTRQGGKCVNFDTCLFSIEKGGNPDYDGISGAIELRPDGRAGDIAMTEVTFDRLDALQGTRTLNAQNIDPESDSRQPDPLFGPKPDGVLRIGTVLPVLGPRGDASRAMIAGIKLAIAEANATGGAIGDPVQLVPDESGDGSVGAALQGAEKAIATERADVIIGGPTVEISQALIEPVTSAGVLLMSPVDGDPTPAGVDDRGLYLRIGPAPSTRAVVTADEVTVDGYTQVYVLASSDPSNDKLVLELGGELEKRGARAAKLTRYDPAATNFDAEATDVFNTGAEATVIIGGTEDTARLIRALAGQTRGPSDTPTYGTDLNVTPELAEAVARL